MIEIKNQTDFDEKLVKPAADNALTTKQIIRIYPTETPYQVTAPIVIQQSNVILQGYGIFPPKIQYVGDSQDHNTGMLHFQGTLDSELENIIVEYLDLDGVDKSKTNVSGIYAEYCGLGNTAGLAAGGYDSSTVGKDIPNKIGFRVKNMKSQSQGARGVWIRLSANSLFSACKFENNVSAGLQIMESKSFITSNIESNANGNGIYFLSSQNCICSGFKCKNNETQNLSIAHGIGIIAKGGICDTAKQGIRLSGNSEFCSITSNVITNSILEGIYIISSCKNITITGNIVKESTDRGIYSDGANIIVEANSITQNSNETHIRSSGDNALILANQMSGAGTGITMSGTGFKQQDNVKV